MKQFESKPALGLVRWGSPPTADETGEIEGVHMKTAVTTGKGKNGTRESLMVDLLDSEKVTTLALRIMALQYGTQPAVLRKEGWRVDGPLVIGRIDTKRVTAGVEWTCVPDRSFAVVGTEGVGWVSDMSGRIVVPMRQGWGGSNDVEISAQTLWSLRSGEQVDFADHVRVFGDRLETNHGIWHKRFTSAS